MSKPEVSLAQYYHERTKYDPEAIASKNKGIDWSNQPVPFKEYKTGKIFDLKSYLADKSSAVTNGLLTRSKKPQLPLFL